uniref:ANK_REP_REGION domain-containing protein n=1 Tax=Steinernema glaseri TaxID=37863 RepID=A0A1I7XYK1_9BILA
MNVTAPGLVHIPRGLRPLSPSPHRRATISTVAPVLPAMQLESLMHRLRCVQARSLTANLTLPPGFRQKLEAVDINERDAAGETMLVAVLRLIENEQERVKFVKLLLDEGADVNATDAREGRTAAMMCCMENLVREGKMIVRTKGCNLHLQDRLGNTAIMYAAMKGNNELMEEMIDVLSKGWGLSALQLKNCMGNTSEDLAIRNGHHRCARMVQSQRLHMLACLNRQMDMVGRIGSRQWNAFAAVYRCLDKWKPRPRRNSEESISATEMIGALPRRRKKSL